MKNSLRLITLLLGSAVAVASFATERKEIRIQRTADMPPPGEDAKAPREKVTFLGVETAPVPPPLAAQLGLAQDMGLVVARLADEGPAKSVLQQHDVLLKFEDQLLVDSRQLSILVRAKKPGDQVKLTIRRAGKESVVTATLGERELPRMFGMRSLGDGANGVQMEFGDNFNIERLRELPGIAREELRDVIRVLGDERGNWFAGPRVHVIRRNGGGPGSTILNMAEGNFVYSDNDGSVEVNATNGDRKLTIKDASGKVTFNGPINSDEERAKLPPEVKERLDKINGTKMEFNAPEEMEREGAKLTPPTKSKVRREINQRDLPPPPAPGRAF